MKSKVKLACERVVREIRLADILPMRKIAKNAKNTVKYRQITASIRQVGLIEPLVVHPQNGKDGKFMLLDGNVRYEVLSELKIDSVKCLVALDDEAFTYNHKVNRLTAIQEHFMIMKAVKSGVSESQIADVLDIDVALIRKKRDLLVGICAEAIELLKGKKATGTTFAQMRKVVPMRQIEMAELMNATNNFSDSYSKCLLAATPNEQLVDKEGSREVEGLSSIDMARMEREMDCALQGLQADRRSSRKERSEPGHRGRLPKNASRQCQNCPVPRQFVSGDPDRASKSGRIADA